MTFDQLTWKFAEECKNRLVKKFRIKNLQSFSRMDKVVETKKHLTVFGECDSDGHIRILIRTPEGLVSVNEILDTVCHEMAHLTHLNHGKKWRKLYKTYHKYIWGLL